MDTKTGEPTTWQTTKNLLLSVFVGFCVSALTVLFQYAVEWLRNIPPELPGGIVGMVKYMAKWKSSHLG